MNRRNFIINTSIASSALLLGSACAKNNAAQSGIIHTVQFTLKHSPTSPAAKNFISDARSILSAIPVVQNFTVLRQISKKNNFQYSFSMLFHDENAYKAYNENPTHLAFVNQRWIPEVSSFLEADYIIM